MHCGWEGNRRSDVALASQTLVVVHLPAQDLGEGDEHPPTHSWSVVDLTFICNSSCGSSPQSPAQIRCLWVSWFIVLIWCVLSYSQPCVIHSWYSYGTIQPNCAESAVKHQLTNSITNWLIAPCGPQGCKNRPAPFPGRMSYTSSPLNQASSVLYQSILKSISQSWFNRRLTKRNTWTYEKYKQSRDNELKYKVKS